MCKPIQMLLTNIAPHFLSSCKTIIAELATTYAIQNMLEQDYYNYFYYQLLRCVAG